MAGSINKESLIFNYVLRILINGLIRCETVTTIGFTIPLTTVKLYAAVPKTYSLNQLYEQNHFKNCFYVFQLIFLIFTCFDL